MAYPGTFLAVSHDRYFLDKVANCTLELADGTLTEYTGGYSYYLMKKEAEAEAEAEERAEQEAEERRQKEKQKQEQPGKAREERSAQKQEQQKAELGRIQSMSDAKRAEMIQRAEAEIAMAEAELKGLEFEMNQPEVQADPARSQQIAEAYAAKEKEIEERYEKWAQLTEA